MSKNKSMVIQILMSIVILLIAFRGYMSDGYLSLGSFILGICITIVYLDRHKNSSST